jgi:hypothetical protein
MTTTSHTPTPTTIKVGKGTLFRSVYADSNALWTVTRSRGKGVFEAVITAEDDGADYVGVAKVFTREEITQSVRWAASCAAGQSRGDAWYDSLTPGQIVHYCNGFKQFQRCVASMHEGKMQLRPIALVGEWREMDLPRRNADGTVYFPYSATNVIEGNHHWRASTTCVYEAPDCSSQYRDVDPRGLRPIDLTPPPIKDEKLTALFRGIRDASSALERVGGFDPKTRVEPRAALEEALAIIQTALTEGAA